MPDATLSDLKFELERGAALTDDVITDLTILSNITGSVSTLTASSSLALNRTNDLIDGLQSTDKLLFVASKLPVVGVFITGARAAVNKTVKPFEEVEDALEDASGLASGINSALGLATLGLGTANLAANLAQFIQTERADALDLYEQRSIDEKVDTANEHDRLVAANDDVEQYIDATSDARDALSVLDFTAWDAVTELFDVYNDQIDTISQVFGEIDDVVDEIIGAIEPLEWALSASKTIQAEVIDPVINTILNATGLSDLMETLTSQIETLLDPVLDFRDGLQNAVIDMENFDIVGLAGNFWTEFSPMFDADGPIDFWTNLGVQTLTDADGNMLILGSRFDDDLMGGAGDDDITGLGGDDTITGGGGDDRAFYLQDITDYRISENADGSINVVSRDTSDHGEGTDLLIDIDSMRFNTPGLGDVGTEFVRDFAYVDDTTNAPLSGESGDDWLFGNAAGNALFGAGGVDRIFGGDGLDYIEGGIGDDHIYAGSGNDRIVIDLSEGVDQVYGGEGRDTVDFIAGEQVVIDFGAGTYSSQSALGSGATPGAFDSIEVVGGTTGDDLFLLAKGVQEIATLGGDDVVRYAGEGDIIRSDDADRSALPSVSFLGGGYQGVRIAHGLDFGAVGTQAYHAENTGLGHGVGQDATELSNISVFEGTEGADVFYGLGLFGNVNSSDAAPFLYDRLTLTGSVMMGGSGTDVFFASEQDNLFDGGGQWDLVNFQLDDDVADRLSETGTRSLTVDLETGVATTIHGGTTSVTTHLRNIEGIVGTRTADTILGNEGANFLSGGRSGQDYIAGRGGDDVIDATRLVSPELFGGAGNDIFVLTATGDATVDGGSGSDTLELAPDQAFRLDSYFEDEVETLGAGALVDVNQETFQWEGWQVDLSANEAIGFFGVQSAGSVEPSEYTHNLTSIENVLGSHLGDDLTGSDASNLMMGRDGNDILEGLGGDDRLDGGAGNDYVDGGVGDDVLIGGAGTDYLSGGDGDDLLIATGGSATLLAGDQDVMTGGAGNDTFRLGLDASSDTPAALPDPLPFPIVTDFDTVEDMLSFVGTGIREEDIRFEAGIDADTGNPHLDVVTDDGILGRLQGLGIEDAEEIFIAFGVEASDDAFDLDLSQSKLITGLLDNDTNSTLGDGLTLTAINGQPVEEDGSGTFNLASGAQLLLGADGTLRLLDNGAYPIGEDEEVEESFTYEVTDDTGSFEVAQATLAITATESGPVAQDDESTTDEDTSILLEPLVNDFGIDLEIIAATSDEGIVEILGGQTLRFFPAENFNGEADIVYDIEDVDGELASAGITVTVAPQNDAPETEDDMASGDASFTTIVDVLSNDSDVEGDTLTVTTATSSNASVDILGDGTLAVTPDADAIGQIEVLHTVSDGEASAESTLYFDISSSDDGSSTDDHQESGFGGLIEALGLLAVFAVFLIT